MWFYKKHVPYGLRCRACGKLLALFDGGRLGSPADGGWRLRDGQSQNFWL